MEFVETATPSVWSGLFLLILFVVSVGLVVTARFKHWTVVEPEPEPAAEPAPPRQAATRSTRQRLADFLARHRWELALAAAIAGVLLFAVVFAPPRLTGEIPIDPGLPGRPFYSLHWQRTFLVNHFDAIAAASNIAAGLVCLAPIFLAIRRRSRLHAEAALLFTSLSLAMFSQWMLARAEFKTFGVMAHLFAIFGFGYWAWTARARLTRDLAPASTKPAWELPLVLLLTALAAFGRFYVLDSVPYGIEGDEAKWTYEAVKLDVLGEPDSNGEYHRDALPVSYYLQAPAHQLFGPGLIEARATVALLSVIASLIFYWLMRQVSPIPVAALSTYLLSVSIFDISASRLANVESFVKLGSVLPLALLGWALKNKPWQAFFLAGLGLALAALTYDTLWPIGLICLLLILIELPKVPALEKVRAAAAMFAPTLLALPLLVPYLLSRVPYYELDSKGWDTGLLAKLGEYSREVWESWFIAPRPDFLLNRPGPLLNASLLPWLALGLAAAALLVRTRSARWLLLWAGIILLPIPILAHSPLGRLYYPALPAVYGLIAVAIYLFWQETRRILAPAFRPLLAALALVPLFWLPLANYFIYFNEAFDPEDRVMRREIGEIAATVTDDSTLLVLAVEPNANEPLNNEIPMVELFLLKNLTGAQMKNAYRTLAPQEVIPAAANELTGWRKLILVLNKSYQAPGDEDIALTRGLMNCFPRGEFIHGRNFDRFIIDETARREADCLPVELRLQAKGSSSLDWELTAGTASSVTLSCKRQKSNYEILEAESLPLQAGWIVDINFAPGWAGSGYLGDLYGSQPIQYEMNTTLSGAEISVWARLFKRVVDHSPAYLTVNDVKTQFADTPEESLNQWIWERIGTFPNQGNVIRLTLDRPYEEDPRGFMALFLDSFLFAEDPSLSPEGSLNETLSPLRFPVSPGASAGTISLDLAPGRYTCTAQVTSTQNLVDNLGAQPVTSNEAEITVP